MVQRQIWREAFLLQLWRIVSGDEEQTTDPLAQDRTSTTAADMTADSITFTEADIEANRNPLTNIDGRIFPRYGKGPKYRTGKCKVCGARCWPYAACAKHRAYRTIHRVMKHLVGDETVEIVKDGRGSKGGRMWQTTDKAKAEYEAEKAARTSRRTSPKIGRNDPCPCGSGRKYKKCCQSTPSQETPQP